MSARNMEDVAEVFKTLKFRKKLIGGVDEMDVWKKLASRPERLSIRLRNAGGTI